MCSNIDDARIESYLKGELSDTSLRAFEEVLGEDVALQKRVAQLEVYFSTLKMVRKERASDMFTEEVLKKIAWNQKRWWQKSIAWLPSIPKEAWGVGITALLVMGFLLPHIDQFRPSDSLPEAPMVYSKKVMTLPSPSLPIESEEITKEKLVISSRALEKKKATPQRVSKEVVVKPKKNTKKQRVPVDTEKGQETLPVPVLSAPETVALKRERALKKIQKIQMEREKHTQKKSRSQQSYSMEAPLEEIEPLREVAPVAVLEVQAEDERQEELFLDNASSVQAMELAPDFDETYELESLGKELETDEEDFPQAMDTTLVATPSKRTSIQKELVALADTSQKVFPFMYTPVVDTLRDGTYLFEIIKKRKFDFMRDLKAQQGIVIFAQELDDGIHLKLHCRW